MRTSTAWCLGRALFLQIQIGPSRAKDQVIHSAQVLDLTAQLDANGMLNWTPPAGRWLVLRIGHTVSNGATR